jgi:isopenicillin N synthase-like dioxygenase
MANLTYPSFVGLYVRNRKSELIKVTIPADCIAFQIGETAQIHSGGILQATPHAVKGTPPSNFEIRALLHRRLIDIFFTPLESFNLLSPLL